MRILLLTVLFCGMGSVQANDLQEGYAVVRNDTIFGKIKINFEQGSLFIKQDSVNRMVLTGLKAVTLLNEQRETYHIYEESGKNIFYRTLVNGSNPLYEKDNQLYSTVDDKLVILESEKSLYYIFGKKEVKDISFIRNIPINNRDGIVELFRHFNHYDDF